MIGVQRELKAEGKDYRAFEILNLGNTSGNTTSESTPTCVKRTAEQLEEKEAAFLDLILRAYRAEKVEGSILFTARKQGG